MIEARGLTKRYGAYTAVDDVSFRAEPGRVTGFLGPNGAGKSTSMRMLVGLTPPTDGTATVLGMPYRSIPNPGRRVGVLLDASAQHNGRTGREVVQAYLSRPHSTIERPSRWLAGFAAVTADARVPAWVPDPMPLGWSVTDTEPAGKAVVALLSDWFPATTGEIVHVDGGFHAVAV